MPNNGERVGAGLERNTIYLDINLEQFIDLVKKFKGAMSYSNFEKKVYLIKEIEDEVDFDAIDFERGGPVFYWSVKSAKLIIHYTIESASEQINLNSGFFEEIIKHSKKDFKVSIWDMEARELFYVAYLNGVLKYDCITEDDFYTDVPYLQKMAKSKGLKKSEGEYNEDEMYDLIYDFTDDLLSSSGLGYISIAPEWFKG